MLVGILSDEYEIIEVDDGARAVSVLQGYMGEIALVMLDIVMPKMDGCEAFRLMEQLRLIFDTVRLVDVAVTTQISVESDGSFVEEEYRCYAVWNKQKRCDNCVSAKALSSRGRIAKFEFVGSHIYYVIAMFVKVDGQPFSLELVSKITDETLLGTYGKEELVETISNFNQKMYTDPATGIFYCPYLLTLYRI